MKAEYTPEQGVVLSFGHNLNDMAIAVHAMLAINRCTNTALLSEIISVVAAISNESTCSLCKKKIDPLESFVFHSKGIRHINCEGVILQFTGGTRNNGH